ncbi:hypothetical protein [Alteromonas sp. a30]|uniref:hypothetical protein n=1 Tax=Alteromonas sp. a30 TaxID=2730917 RepID=UPI00227FACE5|nr:hypothetical protein [Alteromonas sp. a30]MCY7295100.1 hypothetical protein [Alteromonas sp. a30]
MPNPVTENRGYPLPAGNLSEDLGRLQQTINQIDADMLGQETRVAELEARTISIAEARLIKRHPYLGSVLNGNA